MQPILQEKLNEVYAKYGMKKTTGNKFVKQMFTAVNKYICRHAPIEGNMPIFAIPYFGRFRPRVWGWDTAFQKHQAELVKRAKYIKKKRKEKNIKKLNETTTNG